MGGYGSTRWGAYQRKVQVEESLQLNADGFRKYQPGTEILVRWKSNVNLRALRTHNGLVLKYIVEQTLREIEDHITLAHPNNKRWYFDCPDCGRMVAKLYKPFNRILFRCRHCFDLSYRSIQERRKYQGLARTLEKQTDLPVDLWIQFFKMF